MKKILNVRIISLMLAILMIVSTLFACGVDDNVNPPINDPTYTPPGVTVKPGSSSTTTNTTTTTTRPTSSSTTKPNTSGGGSETCTADHIDLNDNGLCDKCNFDVVEIIDFYNFNDLHGKLEDGDSHPGVDEITAYLEDRMNIDEHTVFLSSGDMWQGGSSSNSTKGKIVTDWMNYLGFEAMALGNHEFDWGTDAIRENVDIADFSILAINIYDNATGERADYCEPSVMIERGGVKIGIIGAIGNCHSSIAKDKNKDFNFKTGSALTNLVKAESEKLRDEGADVIVYLLHSDGDDYDLLLSSGDYVDVVFEGHTHQAYATTDAYGVPHVQDGGDNENAMSHVELEVNFANGNIKVNTKRYIPHTECSNYKGSSVISDLLEKYWDDISWIYDTLGYNASDRSSKTIGNTVAKLYYEAAVELWGSEYDIVLAGGQINTRYPYTLSKGDVSYSDLQTILPFDNALYLCSIKGSDLKSKFINNSDYCKYINPNFNTSSIVNTKTYYIVADSWTALYDWAKCTTVELYDGNTFARDFLADFIAEGGWSK